MRLGNYKIKLAPKMKVTGWEAALISFIAIVIALILVGFIFLQAKANPLVGYKEIFAFAFGSKYGLPLTINRAIFILLCTFAFIIPMKAGLWNIGTAGQLYAGALGAFAVAYAFGAKASQGLSAPPAVVITLMVLGSVLSGAVIGAIPGLLKGRFNTNEIVVTMMLNSIAFWFVSFMIKEGGPFMGGGGEGEGFKLLNPLFAPQIMGQPFTIVIALLLAVVLYLLFTRTSIGYQIRTFGQNPTAARYSGISAYNIPLLVFILGGMIAGFAGYHYFAAVPGVYKITMNYGDLGDLSFYGIICGLISQMNPLAAIPMALIFGGLTNGGRFVQGKLMLGFGIDYALLGILMISLVAFQFFYRYRVTWEKVKEE